MYLTLFELNYIEFVMANKFTTHNVLFDSKIKTLVSGAWNYLRMTSY